MIRFLVACALVLLPACTKKKPEESAVPSMAATSPAQAPGQPPPPAPAAAQTPEVSADQALVSKGKAMYLAYCSACHNSNPKQAGTLGPDVYGSSLALLEARILKAEYPPGYEPKRKSKAMVALPQVKADIPALHAFLNAP